ncbi:MAG: hypothetical protein FWG10_07275 [Eubacteriaceae bacterium]|nr:hypothetical protein [Eubacteriaceae bacterium]
MRITITILIYAIIAIIDVRKLDFKHRKKEFFIFVALFILSFSYAFLYVYKLSYVSTIERLFMFMESKGLSLFYTQEIR